MQLAEAIALIRHDAVGATKAKRWADLGCGSGLFTRALASGQPPGSVIYAVDTDRTALTSIGSFNEVAIQPIRQDFVHTDWPFDTLDGILMANSLHYVPDKPAFIDKATRHLTATGGFLIVEYDSDRANPWVPYPLSYASLTQLFNKSGYSQVEKLHERPSLYGRANLYSAWISR